MQPKIWSSEPTTPTHETEVVPEGQLQRVNDVLDSIDLLDAQVLRVAKSVQAYAEGQSSVQPEAELPVLGQLNSDIEQFSTIPDVQRSEQGAKLEETVREVLKSMPESETGYEDLVRQTELARQMTEYSELKELLNGDIRTYILDLCGITDDDPLAALIPGVAKHAEWDERGVRTNFDLGYDAKSDTSYVTGDVFDGVLMVMGGKSLDSFYELFQEAAKGTEIVDKKVLRRLALVYVAGHEMGHVMTRFVGQGFWPDPDVISYDSTPSMAYLMKHPEEAMSYHPGEAEIIEEERFAEGLGQQIAIRFASEWASSTTTTRNDFNEHWAQVIGKRTEEIIVATRDDRQFWGIHHLADSEADTRPINGSKTSEEAISRRRQAQYVGYDNALTLLELQQRLDQLRIYAKDPDQLDNDRAQLRIMTDRNALLPWAEYVREHGDDAPRQRVIRAARREVRRGAVAGLDEDEIAVLGTYAGAKRLKAMQALLGVIDKTDSAVKSVTRKTTQP